MNSVLNVNVSCFESYAGKTPKTVNLLTWLNANKYAKEVQALRMLKEKATRDQIKASLPAITVSGLFNPSRKAENLVKHSGLICIDIDAKGNEHITNFSALKQELFKIENVAYAGLSASGNGFFLIIPITYPNQHQAHFKSIEKDLARYGLNIDPAPKNVASLRGYSWDSEALFRHDAKPYFRYFKPLLPKVRKTSKIAKLNAVKPPVKDTKSQVEQAIQRLTQNRTDITGSEPTWFRIACAFANEFGEWGRDYFHQVSQFHPEYDACKTDRKFDHALKGQFLQIGIGTFFGMVG